MEKRGEEVLEKYVKAVLYAYPLLEIMEEDYRIHIRNRALLSCLSTAPAEKTAEYIAGEILEKRKIEDLRNTVKEVLDKLSDVERALVAIRYFRKERKIKRPLAPEKAKGWSDGKYFRVQNRLGNKISGLFRFAGLTEEVFERDFSKIELFRKINRFLEKGKDCVVTDAEKSWF